MIFSGRVCVLIECFTSRLSGCAKLPHSHPGSPCNDSTLALANSSFLISSPSQRGKNKTDSARLAVASPLRCSAVTPKRARKKSGRKQPSSAALHERLRKTLSAGVGIDVEEHSIIISGASRGSAARR